MHKSLTDTGGYKRRQNRMLCMYSSEPRAQYALILMLAFSLVVLLGCSENRHTTRFEENEREWTVYISGKKQPPTYKYPHLIPAAYHANRLLEGDFRLFTPIPQAVRPANLPYHLQRLIEIGEDSTPLLIELLECDDKTGFEYTVRPESTFVSSLYAVEPWESNELHAMTIADMASFALRTIHNQDFGFRSYRNFDDRNQAIDQWAGYWKERSGED